MKKFLVGFFVLLSFSSKGEEIILGEEIVKPIPFYKMSFGYDVDLGKTLSGFNNSGITWQFPRQYINGQISFETGLYKYLSAGATFEFCHNYSSPSMNISSGSDLFKLSVFVKPLYSFNDRIAIYAKFRGGISGGAGNDLFPATELALGNRLKYAKAYSGGDYHVQPFGFTLASSVGIDFFPWSRLGFFAEWGIKTDYIFFTKKRDRPGVLGDGSRNSALSKDSPSFQSYMIYNFPVTLGIHVIF